VIVAFEGLPGVGKTTTAQLLAGELGANSVIESTHNHPFLESVYRDGHRHDLEVELAFLLLHANAWRSIDRSATTVTDFTPVKDLLFARDTLADEDLRLFEAIYERLNEGSAPLQTWWSTCTAPRRSRFSASANATSTTSTAALRKRWSSTASTG
jgi:deoxyadenosine/deoxycytidine kinase